MEPAPATPARAPAPARAPRRVIGVDIARGLAIIGMFIAHLGLERSTELFSTTGWFWLADGRSSSLFALLAGVGLAFMSKDAWSSGDPERYRAVRIRVFKRAAALMVLGWVLVALGTPVAIILGAYALMFVLTTPFLRLRPGALLGVAAAVIVVMPTLVLLTRSVVLGSADEGSYDPSAQIATVIPVIADLWSGYYPALSWVAFPLVGLAIGRLPIAHAGTQVLLLLAGALTAVAGYGLGSVLERRTQGLTQDLVTISPHADTATEILGNLGAAVAVLGVCLLLTTSLRAVRVLVTPVAAMGAMSLTVYSLHIVYIAVLGEAAVRQPQSNWPLLALVLGAMVFATIWRTTLGSGPLERLIADLSRAAPHPERTPPPGPPVPR